MTKSEIRKLVQQKLSFLLPEQRTDQSTLILEQLYGLPRLKDARNILLYVSLPHEVDTRDLIQNCLQTKQVYIPKANRENKTLELFQLKKWEDLIPGAFGILEPPTTTTVDLEEIDLAIIPGVAFTQEGKRIGHGLGYYDQLLNHARRPFTIGLALREQMVEDFETETHDINLDQIITV